VQQLFDLTGKVAIVTGGSRGLGLEIAEGLAEAGARLMICARRDAWLTPALAELRAAGHQVEGLVCDVANPVQVQAVVDGTVAAFGKVDILVNNAGVSWADRPETMALEKWRMVIDTNLTGAFLFAQAAARDMLTRQDGRIINIASIAGLFSLVNGPHYAAYSASKAGLLGLSAALAKEYGRKGITSNALLLSLFETEMTLKELSAQNRDFYARHCPIGRAGQVSEAAAAVLFLASDGASFVNGQELGVTGGLDWLH